MPSWEYNLGENVLEMNYLSLTTTEAAIFLMTDSNMYCFSETGILKFFKRLQLTPLCSHIYSRGTLTTNCRKYIRQNYQRTFR